MKDQELLVVQCSQSHLCLGSDCDLGSSRSDLAKRPSFLLFGPHCYLGHTSTEVLHLPIKEHDLTCSH